MSAFLVLLSGLIIVAQAYDLGDPSGLQFNVNTEYAHSYEDYKPRDYNFEYGVSDPHTGDHKTHWEIRENGVVRGEYSLLEPDGTTRIVQYTADDHNGFRAVVKKIGHAIHPQTIHHSSELLSSPIVVDSEPYYKSYDGAAENYINILNDASLSSLLSNGLNEHHSIPTISLPQILGSEIPSLSLDEHSSLPLEYSIGIPKVEHSIESVPILSPQIESIPEPIQIHQSSQIYEPTKLEPVKLLSLKEEPVSLGIRIEHPHGESSSSFIGRTGNIDDDSAYTSYAKGIPSVGWESLGANLQDSLGGYGSPIPYQYLSKRSVKKEAKNSA